MTNASGALPDARSSIHGRLADLLSAIAGADGPAGLRRLISAELPQLLTGDRAVLALVDAAGGTLDTGTGGADAVIPLDHADSPPAGCLRPGRGRASSEQGRGDDKPRGTRAE